MLVGVRARRLFLLLLAGTLVPASSAYGQSSDTTTASDSTTTTTTEVTASTSEETTTTTTTDEVTTMTTTTTDEPTTTTTTTAPGAGLRIAVTDEAMLADDAPVTSGVLRAALGTVEVIDERQGGDRPWTVTVACIDFVTGSGSPAETIPCSQVRYASGDATAVEGDPSTLVPGQPSGAPPVDLGSPRVVFSGEGGTGRVRVTWSPTVEVLLPQTAVSGEYRGTITHSVA